MSDISFNCPSCKQSLDAPQDMAGQLVDCPQCKSAIEVPIPRPAPQPKVETKLSAPAKASNPLPKILAVLIIIALMVGSFFAYNFWKDHQRAKEDQERAKAEAPFFLAAKDALDEAHKMQSAVGIGINYPKYGDMLIALAPKVDTLCRAAADTGIENLKTDAKLFCQKLLEARDEYKAARESWAFTLEHYSSIKPGEKFLQEHWTTASEAVDQADKLYSKLKNQ